MSKHYLEFEKPILELASRIQELEQMALDGRDVPEKDLPAEIKRLEIKQARVSRLIYRNLSPWQRVQVARHPDRPHAKDYIKGLFTDYVELHGDRTFADDKALVGGLARFNGRAVAVLGVDKGKTTQDRVRQNFGMPKPDGYRKAQRIMDLAHKFNLPLMTFVDTPGAYPGIDAEARGQGEAIAKSIEKLLQLNVPVLTVITGEGGSGGALALAVADHVLMLENSVYSVISPEGCASILWKEADKQNISSAAEALKLTAQDLQQHAVVDTLIKEPVGGAHRDPALTLDRVKESLEDVFEKIDSFEGDFIKARRQKFLNLTRT